VKIWALSDLHLSFASEKPMDIFGSQWKDHPERIAAAWRSSVRDEDWVLLAGDLSWAMRIDQVLPDLDYVHRLPGSKLMIKGNHAHWWGSKSKVKAVLPDSIHILQNDSFLLPDGTCVAGTRGWNPPGRTEGGEYSDNDRKIYERELGRLRLSIQDAGRHDYERLWAMIHYPPIYSFGLETDFVPILEQAGVEVCVYGHLHGEDLASGFVGEQRGVRYVMASCDYTGFAPVLLRDAG